MTIVRSGVTMSWTAGSMPRSSTGVSLLPAEATAALRRKLMLEE